MQSNSNSKRANSPFQTSPPQQLAGDDQAHDLVGAFEDLVHPDVAQEALDWIVAQVAIATVKLQRLGTEGQRIGDEYHRLSYALAYGGGIRWDLSYAWSMDAHLSIRNAGTDYLDDVTGRQLVYQDILSNPGSLNGAQAARIANPGVEPGDPVDDLIFRRGGDSDDFYFLINLTVGIRLGGWSGGRGGSGCYSF